MTILAEATMTTMGGRHITIHTDGAVHSNPGPGGWGAVLCRMDGEIELSRLERWGFDPDPTTTNIRMEMIAVARALEVVKPGEPQPIIVRPDLDLIVKGMTAWLPGWKGRGWRKSDGSPVENADLWRRIETATEGKTVHWLWVRGHAGDPRNERADQLANQEKRRAIRRMFTEAA